MFLDSIEVRIDLPRAHPVVVVQKDNEIPICSQQELNLACEVGHVVRHRLMRLFDREVRRGQEVKA